MFQQASTRRIERSRGHRMGCKSSRPSKSRTYHSSPCRIIAQSPQSHTRAAWHRTSVTAFQTRCCISSFEDYRSEDGPPNDLSDRRHFVRSRQGVERVHHFSGSGPWSVADRYEWERSATVEGFAGLSQQVVAERPSL